ncbi:MAG: aspartate ammonia-lyase [Euryarchaeota archaeon]|nr:aspartate ammonia-lyase [Euryarchaeota archaeon]MDE1837005.1 aspartate ammonia-lyase [Euryarchaeota archaeon]MDE1879855.1 aspartate ammonia-lyase [Euryarchaeota archaeon]MDE2045663.1 aspartate ammonia-lyase [Thermoplasmata archaeon]
MFAEKHPARTEKDSLGPKEVPGDAYYGVQALRAKENFPVSGLPLPPDLVRAYALVKLACVEANEKLGTVEPTKSKAIAQAAREVADGKLRDQFIVDVFQAGAGTSTNMNTNEVLANRALEILGHPRGDYAFLSPNDHVNRGQSTNDTFPTALNVSILFALEAVEASVLRLVGSLERKAKEFGGLPKAGRTHLKDAMPVTLGGELQAYASTLRRVLEALPRVRDDLCEIALGGSAVGSGVNTAVGFRKLAVSRLAVHTKLPLKVARDPFETMQSRRAASEASAWLRALAVELTRIANDLRLLSSGPTTGMDEVRLPEVQPGSSIMPGKVNPSMAECLNQVCFHVIGSDLATSLASQAGQLEINVMMPVMAYEVLFSSRILSNFLPAFAEKCIDGLSANPTKMEQFLLSSHALATVLTPRLGYLKVAEVIKKAAASGMNPRDYLVKEGILSAKEGEELLGLQALIKMTHPVE